MPQQPCPSSALPDAGAAVTTKALRYYCSFQPGSYPPRLIHHNAYGWACAPPGAVVPGQPEGISMNQVCNNMYEKAPIMDDVAKYGNYADPYSWKCYEGS